MSMHEDSNVLVSKLLLKVNLLRELRKSYKSDYLSPHHRLSGLILLHCILLTFICRSNAPEMMLCLKKVAYIMSMTSVW